MSCSDLKVSVVEQFTFVTDRKKADDILQDLALNCKEVKIRAAVQLRLKKDRSVVKLVHANCADDLRKVLKHHCVKYCRQKVLFVELGEYAVKDLAHVARRFCGKVHVNAFYFSRCGNGVYQVSSIRKAKRAISEDSSSPKKCKSSSSSSSSSSDDKCHKKCSSSSSSSDDKCKKKSSSSSSSSSDDKCSKKKCKSSSHNHKKSHKKHRHHRNQDWSQRTQHAPACDGAQ